MTKVRVTAAIMDFTEDAFLKDEKNTLNVKVDTDGRTVIAEINGQVLLLNGKICVEPVMEVDGVNVKTGNSI